MSKSRLEKFLYALYSLDSSDLPNPLSRIEELYKCLVTGEEAPFFEPISRVEKYLMAILGAYDVDSLPNPLSRVEVLLYKLATGDDNLDDVKSFLSEHEELLAEIIRNGGVGGNIDIEYVLHTLSSRYNTLYNTAKKPVKSAILKGQTLVNLLTQESSTNMYATRTQIDRGYRYTQEYSQSMTSTRIQWDTTDEGHNRLKPNTKYYVQFTLKVNKGRNLRVMFEDGSKYASTLTENSTTTIKCSVLSGELLKRFFVYINPPEDESYIGDTFDILDFMTIEYQDGMENWDIPYFEGMQSVKMPVLTTTGFNLFDGVLANGGIGDSTGGVIAGNSPVHKHTKNFIKVSQNDNLCVYYESDGYAGTSKAYFYDKNKNYLNLNMDISSKSTTSKVITVPNDANICYMKIRFFSSNNNEVKPKNIIIAKTDNVITAYENYEYKSNILTVNEEVELRGIGEVKDELNLLTGELTQRIEEYTELSNQGCATSNYYQLDGHTTFTFGDWSNKIKPNVSSIFSNKLPYPTQSEGVIYDNHSLYIRIKNDKLTTLDIEGLKEWLIKEHFTITFPMKTETVKTVDLSVVDQDGNNTKLSTFNDITYVTLSSEGAIPEAELEVATKNEEVLSTLSLETDDIYATQTTLEETSNTQSENVDATMFATTEIYEELL